jgi:hypothetical protein
MLSQELLMNMKPQSDKNKSLTMLFLKKMSKNAKKKKNSEKEKSKKHPKPWKKLKLPFLDVKPKN